MSEAVLIIESEHTRRTTEQVAAWYTEVKLTPGEYEIIAPGPLPYFRRASVDGVIVDEHFPPMFGGVAYGPGQKRNVGKPTTYSFGIPDSVEERPDLVKLFNAAFAGEARIELRP